MTTISQLSHLDRTAPAPQADLATIALRRLHAALAGFTAHTPNQPAATAPARDITLRARRPNAGPSLTASQRFLLPR